MKKLFILGGTLVERGETREVYLPITEAANSRPVLLPITVIRGKEDGLRLLLTGAVHGDELNGTAILRNLLATLNPEDIRGTLIIIPIVNIIGFLARSRYLPDRRDLNRFFPGNSKGNMTQRITHRIFHDVVKHADVCIDLHTAAFGRENFPHIRGSLKNAVVRKYAKSFDVPVLVDDPGRTGTLRRAATQAGVPTLLFEGGTSNRFQRSIVRSGLNGILTFLKKNGILKRKKILRKTPFQITVRKTQWIRAERGGLLELKVHPGSLLYRGTSVATISNPLGREVHLLSSPVTGLVLGVTTSPVVNPGTPVVQVAHIQKTLGAVEKAISTGKLKTFVPS